MKNFIALISGFIFSVGLIVSGMTDPNKVIGFLDLFGEWDMSLAFVMGGAVLVNFMTFKFILKKGKPAICENFDLPQATAIDYKIILGPTLFGIGWGIVGMCPGPAIVNLTSLDLSAFIFIFSMVIGMSLFRFTKRFYM